MLYPTLSQTIHQLSWDDLSDERQILLQPLINYIQLKVDNMQPVNLSFICTHNSRRSHLAQVWGQTASAYFNIPNVQCYSGGTEETALFPKIAETLNQHGFKVFKITDGDNPVYAIKCSENAVPVIGFSKKHNHPFNPASAFAAILTCSDADVGCPYINGAETRIAATYEDPKIADNTAEQSAVYSARSLQIATEMFYVFSRISPNFK